MNEAKIKNEAAIKALTALINQPLPELVHQAVLGAIKDLEAEAAPPKNTNLERIQMRFQSFLWSKGDRE